MTEHISWDPARIELLWGLKEPPKRGPRPALSVPDIARAGIELADAEGLEALSMQRLAKRLGVGTMSLYTYVPDKASLLEVMLDMIFEDVGAQDTVDDWRMVLERTAYAIRAAYYQHPWALHVVVTGPPIGPNHLTFMESALEAMSGSGLTDNEMLESVLLISGYVRGSANLSSGTVWSEASSQTNDEEFDERYAAAFRKAIDPARFPLTSKLMLSTVHPAPDSAQDGYDLGFRFGLERILDGIEAYLKPRTAPHAGRIPGASSTRDIT